MNARPDPMIAAPDALALHGRTGVRFIDASWTFPGGPKIETEGVIPGALAFDIDEVADTTSVLPHMLPSAMSFSNHMDRLGISRDDSLIVYDALGLFSAPRVWWMFRAMGHDDVRVLDGGLPAWIAAGGDIAESHAALVPGEGYVAELSTDAAASAYHVRDAGETGSAQILDVRGADRFRGIAPETRAGLRSGHAPGARNLPFGRLLTADQTLKSAEEIRALMDEAGIDLDRPVITSCGSGVTACIASLALDRIGVHSAVYDGSWVEWGARQEWPIERGEPA